MLEEGLSYPGWGDRWTGRFVIGATLWFLSPLLVPLLVLYGYGMRAMGETARGDDVPPQWRDWSGLALEGLRALAVGLVYALIPNAVGAVVLGVFLFLLAGGGAVGGSEGGLLAGVGLLALLFGGLVVLVVEVVVLLLLPAALVNVAAEDSLAAGFDVGAIAGVALSGPYLAALVHLLFVWVVVLVVGSVASVTVVLLPAVLFWGGLVSARLLGLAYRGATNAGVPTDATPAPTADADDASTDDDVSFAEPTASADDGGFGGADEGFTSGSDDGFEGEDDDEFEGEDDDEFEEPEPGFGGSDEGFN